MQRRGATGNDGEIYAVHRGALVKTMALDSIWLSPEEQQISTTERKSSLLD